MNISIKPGKYVVAVSGGVDSVVLLDLLNSHLPSPISQIIVAHFDHGIRKESELDRIFVENVAKKYNLPFVYERSNLGENASEAEARQHRYAFLYRIKSQQNADAIVTAHHKNDVIETACINMLRGTYRLGITSLNSKEIIRPLLSFYKQDLITYAQENSLSWREDETNTDHRYLRNSIRARLQSAPATSLSAFEEFIAEYRRLNDEIDSLVEELYMQGYDSQSECFDRNYFITLPYKVANEVLAYWLRIKHIEFDKKHLELLTMHLKTGHNHSQFDAGGDQVFRLSRKQIRMEARSSV